MGTNERILLKLALDLILRLLQTDKDVTDKEVDEARQKAKDAVAKWKK